MKHQKVDLPLLKHLRFLQLVHFFLQELVYLRLKLWTMRVPFRQNKQLHSTRQRYKPTILTAAAFPLHTRDSLHCGKNRICFLFPTLGMGPMSTGQSNKIRGETHTSMHAKEVQTIPLQRHQILHTSSIHLEQTE